MVVVVSAARFSLGLGLLPPVGLGRPRRHLSGEAISRARCKPPRLETRGETLALPGWWLVALVVGCVVEPRVASECVVREERTIPATSDSPFSGVSPGACRDAGPANEKYCGSDCILATLKERVMKIDYRITEVGGYW